MEAYKKPSVCHEKNTVYMEELMPIIRERLEAGMSIKFSPHGTSMLPMLREDIDSVVLSPPPERLKKYDLPLYQREDGSYVLHRVIKVGKSYSCVGDNQFKYERGVEHQQIIGVVTAFIKDNKEHSVDECRYRIYCRTRHFSRPVRYLWLVIKRYLRRIVRKVFIKTYKTR